MVRSFAVVVALLVAFGFSHSFAGELSPEVEEAYRLGMVDWDRGSSITAMPYLKKAADGGHAAAQALYAFLLDAADEDVEAAVYYRKAAALNNPDGMFGLAGFHVSGDGNVEISLAEALRLYKAAGDLGHIQSIRVVALAYLNGSLGVEPAKANNEDVVHWLKKGASNDFVPAMERLSKAYRNGELGLSASKEEADKMQARIVEVTGIDPSKKRRQRR